MSKRRKERRTQERIVAFVMAGGAGKRLWPLTAERCKPAVPFGGRYRIVDFVLSNLVNSGIQSIYLLVQHKPQSLIEHIRKAWTISPLLPDEFVTVVPPQMQDECACYLGTADAVYQSLNLIALHHPSLVAVFSADHIYRMDVRQMVRFHRERNADVTVAARPVAIAEASRFGIIDAASDGRVRGFQEKPEHPQAMAQNPTHAYASMGKYFFDTDVLVESLKRAHENGETDFGHHVLPKMVADYRMYAYDFSTNEVPGLKPYEEKMYWRDVGTLDTYYDAHRDILGLTPRFDEFNPQWPIFSSHYQGPSVMVINSHIDNSQLGAAAVINNATVRNSIIRREVVVEPGAVVDDCIIMDYVHIGRGAHLRRVIVDRYNSVAAGAEIGFDVAEDARRYHVTPAGIVVISKGEAGYFARNGHGIGFGYAD